MVLTLGWSSSARDRWDMVAAQPLTWYRRAFGFILLLEQLFMTDTIIHVVYENWEPCFVPIFRDLNIPVTHTIVDNALYLGMLCSLLMIFDRAIPSLSTVSTITLFLSYTYVRCVHFYNWNNHYYLNMILLALFVLIPSGSTASHTRPRWHYQVIQVFFGTVYFLAGVSKISTAWLDGLITETMTHNHGLLIPNVLLYWGGFLLDLLGGLLIITDAFYDIGRRLFLVNHGAFIGFHAHNLAFLFKSIQFFPLHMLFTPLVFCVDDKTHPAAKPSVRSARPSWSKLPAMICWFIVIFQALFATRRFFILVDNPLDIIKANDIAEFHSQVHQFSWRMKSRTCSSLVLVNGRWPTMMTIGISEVHAQPEDVQYLPHTKVFYNNIYADAEMGIQPLVNRVRRQMSQADPEKVKVNLFWWSEINHDPFQLTVNPELNFIGADHLPLLSAPPATHVEPQVKTPVGWESVIAPYAERLDQEGLSAVPFVSRPIDMWIPNPLIASGNVSFMPSMIACVTGSVLVRYQRTETVCEHAMFSLPEDGQFHLKFQSDVMFLLGFKP